LTFFNKKEDVIDIELTQYGKYQLSKGNFKPVYYAFSDDEILYSNAYVNPTAHKHETAKEASRRIQRDTQRLRTLYEHDGVESRIMILNGHVLNEEGTAIIKNEAPADSLYGVDTITEEKMGQDDRNLVRNFIGHSTIGEREAPSWDVESLFDGSLTNVNISSSSPNIGIKRPVLDFEIDYSFNVQKMSSDDPDYNISANQVRDRYTGLEKEFAFVDDIKVKVDEDVLILSVVEDNVDYDLENFEIEFFEVEETHTNEDANNAEIEQLRRLYFTDRYFRDEHTKRIVSDRYVGHYFDILTDTDLAEEYGFDMRGTNREKIKLLFKKSLADHLARQSIANDPLMRPSNENTPISINDEEDGCDD